MHKISGSQFTGNCDRNLLNISNKRTRSSSESNDFVDDKSVYGGLQMSDNISWNQNDSEPTDILDDAEEQIKWQEVPLWSIDDDSFFQPCGMINHSNGLDKSVFVTWNEDYLLNFRFKKSKHTKRVDMTKVRIMLPPEAGEIREIHILEYNTLLLTSTGHICYFGSVKTLHMLDWLTDVRCFSKAASGFSIIRHDANNARLLLEVYDDVANIGNAESTLKSSYDITYDEENIFNCAWRDEQFTLHSYTIASEDLEYLTQLLGDQIKLNIGQLLHIFTVGGHVFYLTANEANRPNEAAFHIGLICVYAAPVSFINLLPQLNLSFVYLTCGSIDIWYISQLTHLKQRQMHHTGTEFLDFDASSTNGDFYFTDGEQLVRLKFQYITITDDCLVQEEVKHIEGMLACTWQQDLEQLVCLSSNNIFYRISFPATTSCNVLQEDDDVYKLNDITHAELKHLNAKADVVAAYAAKPAELHAAIEREFQKQQLIGVTNKMEIYKQLLTAELSYCLHLPAYDDATVLFCTQAVRPLASDAYLGLLELNLRADNEIFHIALWQLFVYESGGNVHVLHVPVDLLLSKRCIVVVPLRKRPNCQLTELTLKLATFLCCAAQVRAVILPVTVCETKKTYSALFATHSQAMNITSELTINQIIANFKRVKGLTSANLLPSDAISQKFKLPPDCSYKSILQILKLLLPVDLIDVDAEANASSPTADQSFYFMHAPVTIGYEPDTHYLKITSKDVAAIYYVKLHLLLNFSVAVADDDVMVVTTSATEKQTKLLQSILKLQCGVERCYGTQSQTTPSELLGTNAELHLTNLLSIYHKLRQDAG